MEQVIKLVKTYRVSAGLAERLRLAEEIFRLIEPDLRFFVFSAIQPPAAQDVLQEVLKSITTSLKKFEGDTDKEFWAWCYRIARNRLNDHFRKKASDRLQPMPQDELWQLVEASAQASLVLQVQIDRRPCFSNLQGKCRFADLSRAEQDHCRGMSEQVIEACAEAS
jgi:RNA polymerase sigma factor (sigma-70 family)